MEQTIARALRGDDGLDGVRWLLMGAGPQGALRDLLAAQLPGPGLLEGCRLYRAKYKPGRHLTAYYEVMLRDPQGGALHARHVEAAWLPAGAGDPRGAPEGLARAEDEARERGLRGRAGAAGPRPALRGAGAAQDDSPAGQAVRARLGRAHGRLDRRGRAAVCVPGGGARPGGRLTQSPGRRRRPRPARYFSSIVISVTTPPGPSSGSILRRRRRAA